MNTNSHQRGFTIVELLIVIVVIGILAGLVISTFSGVQGRARDAQRQTDIKAVATQLEVYYIDNGSYPTASNINTTTLKGIDAAAFAPPSSTATALLGVSATPTSKPVCPSGSTSPCPAGQEAYAYQGQSCSTSCAKFTLYYWEEYTGAIKSVTSLN